MNEEVRAYARKYIIPPIVSYPSFWEALESWGLTEGLTNANA